MSAAEQRCVGFIGLGTMGWPMAANLVRAGFRLVVDDIDPARRRAFGEEHSTDDADLREAAGDLEALVTMLPDGKAVQAALVESGLVSALRPGTLVIDTSSSAPGATRELGELLSERQLSLLDAPVSGGRAKALDGTLSIMLGTDDEDVASRAMPVLEAMSARIFRTGRLGSGHAVKGLNNYVLAAGFAAAAEALVTGEAFGLDPAVLIEVMNASSGRNVATESVFPAQVLTRRFAEGFPFRLLCKDVGIADQLAHELGVDAPLCAAIRERLAEAADELGLDTDYTRTVELWERRAGVETPPAS